MKHEVRIKPYLPLGLSDSWFKVQYKRIYIQIGCFRLYKWITVANCCTFYKAESVARIVLGCLNGDWMKTNHENHN